MFFDPFVLGESHEEVGHFACDDDVRSADDVKNGGVQHDGRISVEYTRRGRAWHRECTSEKETRCCHDESPAALCEYRDSENYVCTAMSHMGGWGAWPFLQNEGYRWGCSNCDWGGISDLQGH